MVERVCPAEGDAFKEMRGVPGGALVRSWGWAPHEVDGKAFADVFGFVGDGDGVDGCEVVEL